MTIRSLLAAVTYSHDAGTSGTVTAPAGVMVTSVTCYSAGGGTLVVTPKGAKQTATAQPTITIPAGVPFAFPPHVLDLGQLGAGSIFVFAGTDAYLVTYAKV